MEAYTKLLNNLMSLFVSVGIVPDKTTFTYHITSYVVADF